MSFNPSKEYRRKRRAKVPTVGGGDPRNLDPMDEREVRSLFSDIRRFPEWCEKLLLIIPVQGGKKIPFVLNPIQRYFFETRILPNWGEVDESLPALPGQVRYRGGKAIREVILKARQFGFSTLIEAFVLWYILSHHNRNALVAAHKKGSADTIFRMMKRFYRNLPERVGLPTFMTSRMTVERIEFSKPDERVGNYQADEHPWLVNLDSGVETKTAGEDDDLGRSATYQIVHGSECAMWPNFLGAVGSLMSCVHDQPRTCVFFETTAKGMNSFYDFWRYEDVEADLTTATWDRFFAPWYWHAPYELEQPGKEHKFIDQMEEELFARIQKDDELKKIDNAVTEDRVWNKLFWRRHKIRQDFGGDHSIFCQEFPSTAEEAFLYSGTAIWSGQQVRLLERDVVLHPPRYDIVTKFDRIKANIEWVGPGRPYSPLEQEMHEHERGKLKMYETPQKGDRYVLAVDVAEGKAAAGVAEELSKYDFSCIQVLKASTLPLEQVAIWHGNIHPHELGYVAVTLASMYNLGLLSWEVNGIGIALYAPIVEHCRYPNIYMREEVDSLTRRITQKPGFRTSRRTKASMAATGIMFVAEGHLIIHDERTIGEMKVFSRVGENEYTAARGHDDRVMALLQGLEVAEPLIDTFRRDKKRETSVEGKDDRKAEGYLYAWEANTGGKNPYLGGDI